ncbi:ThuA domain-containing protein [Rathayibacter sp. SD072]|uniref:ThuA domain-containing protein n=1 Tax=Rathayibacter sp. SD072 TaxID=2781731 RepID=UPI001A978A24|nr:ThuA domain-containing protein [Rathayibacter sp. SD072]MBO0984572.1 ThuA domain-containing protein [Rathayibacter sp. SD072]
MTTLLLTGEGRYSDPWHPFAETTSAVVALLAARGHRVEVRGDVDRALSDIATGCVTVPDLLVVNAGLPRDGRPAPTPEGRSAFALIERSAIPVLGIHVSSTTFIDAPEWPALLGGRWIRGASMHPDFGPARIRLATEPHPVIEHVTDFDVEDERYCLLDVDPASRVLATHHYEGRDHPIAWALERSGGGRTVYDALGHSASSYTSRGHLALLAGALQWLRR